MNANGYTLGIVLILAGMFMFFATNSVNWMVSVILGAAFMLLEMADRGSKNPL